VLHRIARVLLVSLLVAGWGPPASPAPPPAPPEASKAAPTPAVTLAAATAAPAKASAPVTAAAPAPTKAAAMPEETCKNARITWKLATEAARPTQPVTWADRFKELMEQRTSCQFSVLIYQGGVLGTTKQGIEQVRLGTLDMATAASDMSELYPPFGATDLPFIFRDRAHVAAVLDGPIGKKLNEDLVKSKGVRVLGYGELGFRHITNGTRPINKPEDLKGLKLRVPPSKLRSRTFEIFGAAAAPIPFGELYTALQQKVVDGQENPLSTVWSASYWQVQKYLSLTGHVYTPVFPIVSERSFQKLTPDMRKLMLDTAQEVSIWHRGESARADSELVQKIMEKGMAVNQTNAADFQKEAARVWEEFSEPIGKDLVNAIVNTR